MRWGWSEPLRQTFDCDHPELLLEHGRCVNVWWERNGKQKASGSWRRCWGQLLNPCRTHASIDMAVYESVHQESLLLYLKKISCLTKSDIGLIDSVSETYAPFAMDADFALCSKKGDLSSCTVMLSTHTLRHWLPDMPWAVVFGPAYIQMFGREKLLSTPAYHVEDIGPEAVFIQLTPRMDDIHEQFDMVMASRAQAKQHLGEEAFFKSELAYDYKEEDNIDKVGKVFRVPVFNLLPE